jgi:hypothetical protein
VTNYERLAVDGDGDLWGYGNGGWRCLTNAGAADDDESLSGCCGPVVFYVPAPPPRTVTFDVSEPDALHVLTQALEDYAGHERAMAERLDASESFARWADLADEFRAQAKAAGGIT